MSLLLRISVPPPDEPEAEDIFSSALTTIFTDDAINSWGSPGASITYRSPQYGSIELKVPVHPDEEQGRKLFAHYLWNAGVVAADAIESASSDETPDVESTPGFQWERCHWDVRGKRVLEIGAATALPSLIAALSGAASVTITDHPSSPALTAGAIEQNVQGNLYTAPSGPDSLRATPRTSSTVDIYGYTWGTPTFYLPSTYGRPAPPPDPTSLPPNIPLTAKGYPRPDKIIVADCLWMPSQHDNIIRTILDFLPETPTSQDETDKSNGSSIPCALVVAGFHTGRTVVRDFFAQAVGHDTTPSSSPSPAPSPPPTLANTNTPEINPQDRTAGTNEQQSTGPLRLATIFEMDMEKRTRPWTWAGQRDGEGKWEAKRWCVVGVLVRA